LLGSFEAVGAISTIADEDEFSSPEFTKVGIIEAIDVQQSES